MDSFSSGGDRKATIDDSGRVLQRLRLALSHLRRRYGVVRLALYGSFARGAAVKDSDVDLLVELSRPLGLEFVSLAQYLERKLGRKVDVVTLETFRRSLTSRRYRDLALNIQESMTDVQAEARLRTPGAR
jgi:predicted nucleotidyltransferase